MISLVSVVDLHWHSGLEYALQGVSLFSDTGYPVKYRIIGRGRFLEATIWAIRELGLSGVVSVVTTPAVSILSEMKSADGFLCPAVYPIELKTTSIITRLKTPLIVTDEVKELPIEFKCIKVPKRDPEAIAEAIHQLVKWKSEKPR